MSKVLVTAKNPNAYQNYVRNKEIKYRTPYTINSNGEGFYVLDGQLITEKKLNELFPTGLINTRRHPHLDSRQNIY